MAVFYHRPYDNIMLYPLVIALAVATVSQRSAGLLLALVIVCLLNFLPASIVYRAAAHSTLLAWLNLIAPLAAAFLLAARSLHPSDSTCAR